MNLTEHDLKQLNKQYIASLTREQLLHLSEKMLSDLREARDRLNQTPTNSSRPSGSFAPWEKWEGAKKKEEHEKAEGEEKKAKKAEKTQDEPKEKKEKRKAGKQKGSKGVGRRVELEITGEKVHRASSCVACGAEIKAESVFKSTMGVLVLDIERREMGLEISHIKHLYGKTTCACGHETETKPRRSASEEEWKVKMSEWHLVGPMLAALIISLSLRMRLSRRRIKEFLQDWLGIALSVGCIHQTIREGGRAVAPLEDELIAAIQASDLLHVDETGWKGAQGSAWLWVLTTATTTLYLIGRRSWDVIADIIEGFSGWLMSDGYLPYRKYAQRLRCLAHLIRKARGLDESCDPEAAHFGSLVLGTFSLVIAGIYAARGDPSRQLTLEFADELTQLKQLCSQHRDHPHDKTRRLARELLNDWDAIWQLLAHPDLPITNNAAERALRHWVIARKLSLYSRSPQGSRAFSLLASVIDTCRQRGVSPWPFIARVISERRAGFSAPPLPTL